MAQPPSWLLNNTYFCYDEESFTNNKNNTIHTAKTTAIKIVLIKIHKRWIVNKLSEMYAAHQILQKKSSHIKSDI